MKYVIFISSSNGLDYCTECYGYWTGKNYTLNQEFFPVTQSTINEKVKYYSSLKRAIKGAEKSIGRYSYACRAWVEDLEGNKYYE